MKSLVLWGALLSCLWLDSSAQTLRYGIYWGEDRVGQMEVSRRQAGRRESLRSEAQMTVKMVVSMELVFSYEAEFEGGILARSLTRNLRNGTEKDRSEGSREGDHYVVVREGERHRQPAPAITYTILKSYFEAPGERRSVFSERWGAWLDYLPVGPDRYAMHLPNGDINYLTYRDGRCVEIEISHLFATLHFRLE